MRATLRYVPISIYIISRVTHENFILRWTCIFCLSRLVWSEHSLKLQYHLHYGSTKTTKASLVVAKSSNQIEIIISTRMYRLVVATIVTYALHLRRSSPKLWLTKLGNSHKIVAPSRFATQQILNLLREL